MVRSPALAVALTWATLFAMLAGELYGGWVAPNLRLFTEEFPVLMTPMLLAHVLATVSSALRLPRSALERPEPWVPVPPLRVPEAIADLSVASAPRVASPLRVS
jgi:hypothetical protein